MWQTWYGTFLQQTSVQVRQTVYGTFLTQVSWTMRQVVYVWVCSRWAPHSKWLPGTSQAWPQPEASTYAPQQQRVTVYGTCLWQTSDTMWQVVYGTFLTIVSGTIRQTVYGTFSTTVYGTRLQTVYG